MICSIFFYRRIVPSYPLPFLLAAQITPLMHKIPDKGFYSRAMQRLTGNGKIIRKRIITAILLIVFALVSYMPNSFKRCRKVIFFSKHRIVKEADSLRHLFDKRLKGIFIGGRFAYIALHAPIKFIDIPPDLTAKDVRTVENNPVLLKKLLSKIPDLCYIIARVDDSVTQNIVEKEFRGKVIFKRVAGYGLVYYIPPRVASQRQ